MVHVSKKYLNENLKKEIWSRFAKNISGIKSKEQLDKLLRDLFTPSEIVMLEKRLAIMYLTEHGLKYAEIGKMIDVSSSTISFIKNGFKKSVLKNTTKKVSTLPQTGARNIPSKFKKRKFPTYTGKGRWDFLNNSL